MLTKLYNLFLHNSTPTSSDSNPTIHQNSITLATHKTYHHHFRTSQPIHTVSEPNTSNPLPLSSSDRLIKPVQVRKAGCRGAKGRKAARIR